MIWDSFFFRISLMLLAILDVIPAQTYRLQKRQIGALARTGSLPQGKRSVGKQINVPTNAIGDIFKRRSDAYDQIEEFQHYIRELQPEKNEATSKMNNLIEKLGKSQNSDYGINLTFNGEGTRITKAAVVVEPREKASEEPHFFLQPRVLNIDSENEDEDNIKNESSKRSMSNNDHYKRRSFQEENFAHKDLTSSNLVTLPEFSNGCFSDVSEPKSEESADEEVFAEKKRFLGRIPQLGRTHLKVQSPSSARRRPHLRLLWP